MTVDASGLTDEEVESSLKAALVSELNLHSSDVEVSYDSESGVATYTITSDDAESLVGVVSDMNEDGFSDGLTADGVTISSLTPPSDVTAVVEVSVDASNVDDVQDAVDSVTTTIQNQDESYNVTGDGNFIFFDQHTTQ